MTDVADFITIFLSASAVTISLFGLRVQRRETAHQRVVRLSELIDQINELGLDQERRVADEGPLSPQLRASYNSRREMLGREAMRLMDDLAAAQTERVFGAPDHGATDSQHRFLAHALHRMGDAASARTHFEQAIDGSPPDSVFRLFALRGFASFEYARGAPEEAEKMYRQALDIANTEVGDAGLFLAGETYFHWARQRQAAGGDPGELLDRAEEEYGRIAHKAWRTESLADLRNQRAHLQRLAATAE